MPPSSPTSNVVADAPAAVAGPGRAPVPFLVLALIALCLAGASGAARAQLTVNRSIIEFTPDERIQDIELTNRGNFRLYLDMRVAEIVDPGSADPERRPLDDPRTAPVIVTPKQLLLPPGQRKRVRVIMREVDTDRDRIFRLAVKPYTGKINIDGGGGEAKTSGVKVLVGYDLLLMSRPSRLEPRLEVVRTDTDIEFRNEGNTNILLRKVRQCDASGEDCVELDANRLYAGEVWRVELPRRGPASRYPVEVIRSVGLEGSRDLY